MIPGPPPAPPARSPQRPRTMHDGPFALVRVLLELVVVALFITTFIVQPFRIPSASMAPTLRVGDLLLLNKQAFSPARWSDRLLPARAIHRGDIVVFHFRLQPELHLVKRVAALPGDRLQLRGGHVFINGVPASEPYAVFSPTRPNSFRDDFPALGSPDPNVDPPWWLRLRHEVQDNQLTVPPGQYFVLGDNRNESDDSRYWGFVPQEAIVGEPLLVYFSSAHNGGGLGAMWNSVHAVR